MNGYQLLAWIENCFVRIVRVQIEFLGLIVIYGSVDGRIWNTRELLVAFVFFISTFGLLNALRASPTLSHLLKNWHVNFF